MYYAIGYSVLNGHVKAKELAKASGKSEAWVSQCKKVAKMADTNDKFRKAWQDGKIHGLKDAYELARELGNGGTTTREVYLEDLEAKRNLLMAQLMEIEKAMKTAKRKPVKVAKAK